MSELKISDLGEKRLISEFLRPLFNPKNDVGGVGDDCAMVAGPGGQTWLFSTDRVPADLTAFRLGILDHAGLGGYLARLNISDIAACGGQPLALLLNLGLPHDLPYEAFTSLCRGFGLAAQRHGCQVLGGDITSSQEISIAATAIGATETERVLTRRGAAPGDTIFVTRPIGLTPAAFAFFLQNPGDSITLDDSDTSTLRRQFDLDPMVSLGRRLGASGLCTACMDNTDGVGQSLVELSTASGCAFVLDVPVEMLPRLVRHIACEIGHSPLRLAMSAGADFSLVGTLRGRVTPHEAEALFGESIQTIGYADAGSGVFVRAGTSLRPLDFTGWNYFASTPKRIGIGGVA